MAEIAPQRRARRIAMSDEERDAFLRAQRTCRVASLGADGAPHVTPLWFVWDGEHLWLNSIVRAQRHANLLRDPRVAVVVDAGDDYFGLRGVELSGIVEAVGESPRTGEPNNVVEAVEREFSAKYLQGAPFAHDGKHAWLRITPERQYTWDFRKLATL
jgi:PPOX class probable F420-dependent enzyme